MSIKKYIVSLSDEERTELTAVVKKLKGSSQVAKLLDGKQEAKVIATRLGDPPKGFAKWTLRLLARKVVELEIVESVSHQTVGGVLKKTR